ncbi:PLC-like phosphodiesterase [Schizophyllum commune]
MFPSLSAAQVALSLVSASGIALGASAPLRRASTCNGFSELCDKSFGNVSFVGAHDSYAVGTDNLAVNQDYDVTQQLKDGIRMLQLQVHNQDNTLQLCHTSCSLFNGGTLEDYLKKVKSWMDDNTNDVLSILIVNIDNVAPTEYATVFESAGLDQVSYSPSTSTLSASSWPTLGEMIDDGKRLVTFLDNQADTSSVSYLVDEFTNIWETAYDVTDTTFDCEVNRTKGDTSTQMYLINHFLDKVLLGNPVPDKDNADTTNAASGTGSLGTQVETCTNQYGRAPNFMLVDFYEYGGGSVFQVAADLNGVTYDNSSVAQPKDSSSSSSDSDSAVSLLQMKGASWLALGGIVAGAFMLV